jgi:amphi-Trp domain-containing protein
MTRKSSRDIEKGYTNRQFAAKLRRLADAVEKDRRFSIQIAGERIAVPAHAVFNIEHESSKSEEEIEFQIKWSRTRR